MTTVFVELAKVRHGLLYHPSADAHAAHQVPIAVDLAVILANRMAQVHAPPESPPRLKEKTQGRHYMLTSPSCTGQPFDPTRTASREMAKTTLQLRKFG